MNARKKISLVSLFKLITRPIAEFIKSLRWFAAALIPIVIMCFVFVYLGQGQDVLLIALEAQSKNLFHFFVGLFLTAIWSLMLWFPARLIANIYGRFKLTDSSKKVWPRWIGYNSIVVIHTAFFCLPMYLNPEDHLGLESVWVKGYIAIYIVIQNIPFIWRLLPSKSKVDEQESLKSLVLRTSWQPLFCITPWLALVGFVGNRSEVPFYNVGVMFCVSLIVLQWLLWIFQMQRRRYMEAWNRHTPALIKRFIEFQIRHGLLPAPVRNDSFAYFVFLIGNAIILVSYLTMLVSPAAAFQVGPYYIVLLSLSLVSAIFTLNKAVFAMRVNSPIFIFLCVLLILTSFCTSISDLKVKNQVINDPRRDALTMFKERLSFIKGDQDSADVYIVLSDGGASRSGFWATKVLDSLECVHKGAFMSKVLVMSSTSGGSVGNGYYYHRLALNQLKNDTNKVYVKCREFFRGDFLSHPLSTMLVHDLFLLPYVTHTDRGHALIEAMNYQGRTIGDDIESYDSLSFDLNFCMRKELPMLFLNTTSMKSGRPKVISNVRIDQIETYRKDALRDESGHTYVIPFSAAMVMSSRFPFISPGGVMEDDVYVDGGYFDNSGAGIVLDVLQAAWADSSARQLMRGCKFHVVHIKNDEGRFDENLKFWPISKPSDANVAMNNYLAPIQTVLQTYSSQTSESDLRLRQWFENDMGYRDDSSYYKIYNLYDRIIANDSLAYAQGHYLPGFPMSWVISDYNMMRMERQVH